MKRQEFHVLSKLNEAQTMAQIQQISIPPSLEQRCKAAYKNTMDRITKATQDLVLKIQSSKSVQELRALGIDFWRVEDSGPLSFSDGTDPKIQNVSICLVKIFIKYVILFFTVEKKTT